VHFFEEYLHIFRRNYETMATSFCFVVFLIFQKTTMKEYEKKLGVLGGMGPEATADFYLRIISRCQKKFGAMYNSDFPHIIVNSYPVPDGDMWTNYDKKLVESGLQENAKLLEKCGADFLALPCNSVHNFIGVVREAVDRPVLSIIEEVTKKILEKNLKKITIFGTGFTLSQKIYEKGFEKYGIESVVPCSKHQEQIGEIILRIESGVREEEDKKALIDITDILADKKGVQGIVLGCTEIPLLIKESDFPINAFDTLEILSEEAFRIIVGERSTLSGA
jgi:aspartate racemase